LIRLTDHDDRRAILRSDANSVQRKHPVRAAGVLITPSLSAPPTVEGLVGDEWFTASAYAFLAENLPEDASLSAFGAAYPDFLAMLPATADFPYLPMCWSQQTPLGADIAGG